MNAVLEEMAREGICPRKRTKITTVHTETYKLQPIEIGAKFKHILTKVHDPSPIKADWDKKGEI